jgi:hypothetical protein
MSTCICDDSRNFRVTGEVSDRERHSESAIFGSGEKVARVRCGECGGKVGKNYVGSDLLNLLGVEDSVIEPGVVPYHGEETPTLTVDLI